MEAIFYKSLAKPTLQYGVPVGFLFGNYVFWMLVGAIKGGVALLYSPFVFGCTSHFIVFIVLKEHPLIFFKLWRLILCRFRNLKRGAFGAAYYSPVNFKNSINYKR